MDTWTVGELAAQTGLTVRTLHHYDEIGLARPSRRSPAGHRRYTAADVRRLHRIVALRGFGFSLAEIGALLDSVAADPRAVVRRQLDLANDRIARETRLRDRLIAVQQMFDAAGSPSAAVLVRLIEEMTTVTTEEFERMAAHRQAMTEQLTPGQLAELAAQRKAAWAAMTPGQQAEMRRNRPPIPQK